MRYKLYSVKDTVSGNFSDIQIFNNDEVAKRWFFNLCAESKISRDLQLYYLGDYDVQTAIIIPSVEYIAGGADNE